MALAKGGQTFDDVIEALCVCHVVLVFQEVDGFIMLQVAVGLLFFQLMSLGKFVDGDNDIFGHVFQLCIHSVSFLQKYGLFRGWPMFLFFFCSIYVSIWLVGRLIFGWIIMWLFFL